VSYMSNEKYNRRFILLVVLFVFSIFLLITRPNIIRVLLGWDGLGVISYLLVIFYQSNKSYRAGIVTALTNRLGDTGILICIGLILTYGHWRYFYISNTSIDIGLLFTIIIMLAACTKRAQIPFSAWLPAAIAAPTPVSALVHSSTLVTAGVYLIIRFNIVLEKRFPIIMLMSVGILTILIAGIAAILEEDIKKVIALSTLSQLGVMMITVGAKLPCLAYYHLLSHAYFKAILFMCAGRIIHRIKDYQDIRNMGSGYAHIPIITRIILVANLRLCGMPFLSGFYSKDIILECIFMGNNNILILILILMATILTVAYSIRMSILIIVKQSISETIFTLESKELWIPLGALILLPFSIMGGIMLRWCIFPVSLTVFLPFWLKSIISIIIISGVIFGWNNTFSKRLKKNKLLVEFSRIIFFMPVTFNLVSTWLSLGTGKISFKMLESSWLERAYFKSMFYSLNKILRYTNYLFSSIMLSSIFVIFVVILLI